MRKNWKHTVILLSLAVTVGMGMPGCGKSTTKSQKSDGTSAFKGTFVISAKEAKEKVNDDDVLFVDARGTKKANAGTVEGAVVTDWQSLSTCQEGSAGDEGWGLVPEPEELTNRLQELGIETDKEIIVLGQPEEGWGEEGRILWELREAGCKNVKMVDGGIAAMKDIGVKLKSGVSERKKSDIKVEKLDKSHDITTEELQENYEDYKIVDVRTTKEYEGAVLYDEAKGGHLPGAVNIQYVDIFREDGTLKDKETLTKLFDQSGLKKEDKVVTYCTGGIRSAYVQIVMEMCGYENTYNYCQSYWRWAVVGEVE